MYDITRPQKDQTSPASRVSPFVVDQFDNWQLAASVRTNVSSPYKVPIIGAVGGGKGGVGKSIVSANLASMLAQFGFGYSLLIWMSGVQTSILISAFRCPKNLSRTFY